MFIKDHASRITPFWLFIFFVLGHRLSWAWWRAKIHWLSRRSFTSLRDSYSIVPPHSLLALDLILQLWLKNDRLTKYKKRRENIFFGEILQPQKLLKMKPQNALLREIWGNILLENDFYRLYEHKFHPSFTLWSNSTCSLVTSLI